MSERIEHDTLGEVRVPAERLWGEFEKLLLVAERPSLGFTLARELGVLDEENGVALRATFVVDPHNVVQHVYVTNLNVGRSPEDTLRVVDALQTDELCACNRPVGGETLAA